MNDTALNWLLEEGNPGVRLRALTGLCGLPDTATEVVAARAAVLRTLDAARDLSWMNDKILRPLYGLTALAESGLARHDVPIDGEVDRLLEQPFDAGCGDYLLMRALVMLGYGADPRLQSRLALMLETQLPDGGWFCLHRLHKMKRPPKSCMKAAMHALLLLGEMSKRGLHADCGDALAGYFLRRRLVYRMDDPSRLVLDERPGWRSVDAFFPIEVMRVGLPLLLEAMSALGLGRAPELQDAWAILAAKQDAQGRVPLDGTLTKPYLPKERIGKPSKWMTLYTELAQQGRDGDGRAGVRG